MVQQIIIGLLFLGALIYLGNLLYKHFKGDAGCSKGCGCDSPVHQMQKSRGNSN